MNNINVHIHALIKMNFLIIRPLILNMEYFIQSFKCKYSN